MHTHTHIRTQTRTHTQIFNAYTHMHTLTHVIHTNTCKKTYTLITFSTKVLKDAEAHLELATQECSYYKSLIDTAKAVLRETFTIDGKLKVPC